MITTADVNVAVGRRKLEILMQTPIGRRCIKDQAINSLVAQKYSRADAEKIFHLIDKGLIKNVCIGESNATR